ncbi:MAG: hypothetical protein EBQ56_17655 [Proteobacteria bacterium]|nr:hypothetical protein [Pseudomonadota bacterium]NDE07862.1 hypothetical protein [Chloroflexota bacterium]NBT18959.1 hypothetical protein [Pseudomonadota bacterium]NBY49557.1 hypothetical protein [Pseudomonadota bacterium]NCV00333.1 hypothetical protein [Pseudomonadota bacterium]
MNARTGLSKGNALIPLELAINLSAPLTSSPGTHQCVVDRGNPAILSTSGHNEPVRKAVRPDAERGNLSAIDQARLRCSKGDGIAE